MRRGKCRLRCVDGALSHRASRCYQPARTYLVSTSPHPPNLSLSGTLPRAHIFMHSSQHSSAILHCLQLQVSPRYRPVLPGRKGSPHAASNTTPNHESTHTKQQQVFVQASYGIIQSSYRSAPPWNPSGSPREHLPIFVAWDPHHKSIR